MARAFVMGLKKNNAKPKRPKNIFFGILELGAWPSKIKHIGGGSGSGRVKHC